MKKIKTISEALSFLGYEVSVAIPETVFDEVIEQAYKLVQYYKRREKIMKFVNLTPHVINVMRQDGTTANFPPSGNVARVATKATLVATLEGIEIYETNFGEVVGLPEAQENIVYIVSGLVLDACKGTRGDLVAPGDLLRNTEGQPIGCKGFRR